jgi:hypothetical protein
MKKLMLCLTLLVAVQFNLLAATEVPKVVQDAFARLYPQITALDWEHRPEGIVATFVDEEGLKKAFFNVEGYWIETRNRMATNQLPAPVQKFIQNNYSGASISFAGRVYDPNGVWYRVESELSDRVVLKTLNTDGTLIEERTIWFSTSLPLLKPENKQGIAPKVVKG